MTLAALMSSMTTMALAAGAAGDLSGKWTFNGDVQGTTGTFTGSRDKA